MELIDIGANLINKRFDQDLSDVLDRAIKAGVKTILVTGTNLSVSQKALTLSEKYPDILYSTSGIHPHDAKTWNTKVYQELKSLLQNKQVVAVGECGLDFNRDFSPRDIQEKCFIDQLELAKDVKKPLFLHERDAFDRFYSIFKPYSDQVSAVVHCFTGSLSEMRSYLDLGCYIGITGWVCDERRGQELRDIVGYIPMDRLLIETDAPFLTPGNLPNGLKTKRNEPAFLVYVAEKLAEILQQDKEEIAQHSSNNAKRLFELT